MVTKSLTQVSSGDFDDDEPAWSPDGKWIAYSSQLDPKLFEYLTKHIAVVPVPDIGGKNEVLRRRTAQVYNRTYGMCSAGGVGAE